MATQKTSTEADDANSAATTGYRPILNQVIVIQKNSELHCRLRVYLDAGDAGTVCFETGPEFTKSEADYRAVLLSRHHGFSHEELPTHSYQMPYPKR